MSEVEEFQELLDSVREGSESAARQLVHLYGGHVRRAVRRRMSPQIRSKFDSLDFVQSVWASFFENRLELPQFGSPEQMVHFLAQVAEHKVIEECRKRFYSKGRNVVREESVGNAGLGPDPSLPRPSETARANEMFQLMLEKVPPDFRAVLELKLGGSTHDEIAEALGIDCKTVQRLLRRMERRILE